jgi:hypothetical protein
VGNKRSIPFSLLFFSDKDYWTRGMARPDLVLQDLIQAQFPDYFNKRDRVFIRQYSNNESSNTATSDYECNLDSWSKASAPSSYQNLDADAPTIERGSNKLSLGAIIGISVGCGLVFLTCVLTAVLAFIRKMKDQSGKRFTRLHEEVNNDFGDDILDKDPMLAMEESHVSGDGK